MHFGPAGYYHYNSPFYNYFSRKTMKVGKNPKKTSKQDVCAEEAQTAPSPPNSECEYTPKIAVSMSCFQRPSNDMHMFVKSLLDMIPNSSFIKKKNMCVKSFCNLAYSHGYTAVVMVTEKNGKPRYMTIANMYDDVSSYTAIFKIGSYILPSQIHNRGTSCAQFYPQLNIKNFKSNVGSCVAKLFISLFPNHPHFVHRQIVTFYNENNYIFVRYHRFIFENQTKVGLQELGPRFTLSLKWIKEGSFHMPPSRFEWIDDIKINGKHVKNLKL